jgi:uncharacterized protein with PIN domain
MTPSNGSDTIVDLAVALPETKERRCPSCHGGTITPANHLLAIDDRLIKVTKEEFRCRACGTAFWIVRKSLN